MDFFDLNLTKVQIIPENGALITLIFFHHFFPGKNGPSYKYFL